VVSGRCLLFSGPYSQYFIRVLFAAITRYYASSNLKVLLYLNVAVGLALVIQSTLYYQIKIDWSAVNAGQAELTFWQSLIHNPSTMYLTYGFGLLIALFLVIKSRFKN
jgi:hypothetical protein